MDTRKQFSCLVRPEIIELIFEIEPPENIRIEPVHQAGRADEQSFELQWWRLGFGDKIEMLAALAG